MVFCHLRLCMRSTKVVKIFPLYQLLIKQVCIINHNTIQHSVKFFFIYSIASFNFSIQPWLPWLYIYMIHPFIQNMPMELSLEFRSVNW